MVSHVAVEDSKKINKRTKTPNKNIHPTQKRFFLKPQVPTPTKIKKAIYSSIQKQIVVKPTNSRFINRDKTRVSVSSPSRQSPRGSAGQLCSSASNRKPHRVTFLWGNLEEGEGRAEFAYIIIIFKTQSASQTNEQTNKSSTLISSTHLCYKLSQDLRTPLGPQNPNGQGEKTIARMWKRDTLDGWGLGRSQNKKDVQTQWASFQSRHKNVSVSKYLSCRIPGLQRKK